MVMSVTEYDFWSGEKVAGRSWVILKTFWILSCIFHPPSPGSTDYSVMILLVIAVYLVICRFLVMLSVAQTLVPKYLCGIIFSYVCNITLNVSRLN